MKYEIGQQVWRATFDSETNYVTCPDCGGTGRLRVTFHDDTQVSIECRNCSVGYDPPTGRVRVHDRKPHARLIEISGVEINSEGTTWRTRDSYLVPESEIFDNQADCMFAAQAKAEQFDREERERISKKEKDTRTWAWNASYHRGCIKRAQRDIEYHTAKLAVAAIKAKEDRKTVPA